MQWTDRQLETIELRKHNILVSAAAGSGKTAVLIERIKQLILSDGVEVDRLLVVTFTKAAASEMKEKLIRSLNLAVRENPEQAESLRLQLDRISRSNISTFHSFALEIIRRYFHLIDLDPGFKVCDEAESKLMKADGMDRVFEAYFESGDSAFFEYIHCYASPKNENELKKGLISLYDKIRSIPDPFQWLDLAVENIKQTDEEFIESGFVRFVKEHIIKRIIIAIESMTKGAGLLEEYGIVGAATQCRKDIAYIEMIHAAMIDGQFDLARDLILSFKPNTMTAPKDQKEDYEFIKDQVKGYRDIAKDIIRKELLPKFFSTGLTDSLNDVRSTYGSTVVLSNILKKFHFKYSEIKREKSLLDFGDIEHFAIDILKNPCAAGEYRDKFQYIFIDEYQDSNLLQETIVNSIRQHDNVFMVGDIKQSIYKFRLAEPEIFQKKYAHYKNPETLNSTKIDLNQNFRSKNTIINAVNGIFSHLMEYDQDAALYQGIPSIEFPDKPVELYIVNRLASSIEEVEISDSNIEELKSTELEALAAAQIIKSSIGTIIYDVKAGIERPLLKGDIVILMHGVKRKAEIFYRALQDFDIDAYVDDHSGYFDTLEIINFSDLLRVIDNDKRDIPLLGVLRSPIFDFSIDDLIEIRSQSKEITFHGAFRNYGLYGSKQELKDKTKNVLARIGQWKKESRYMPIDEFAWKLLCETGYYSYVGGMLGGTLRQANLQIFVERSKAFRKSGDGSIYGLLRYMNALAEKEVETGQASIVGENDDTVRIMTIHKSKGLEFPFVLVASLGSRFINDRMDKTGVMHKDFGIGITRFQKEENWFRNTLLQHAILSKKRNEELDEAVRVLYVAFTRAMDRLVLLGSVANWEKDQIKYESGSKAESNYLGMIYPHLENAGIQVNFFERESLQKQTKNNIAKQISVENLIRDAIEGNPIKMEQENAITINHRLTYQYRNEEEKFKKSKYSVSELNATHFFDTAINKPRFLNDGQMFSAAKLGDIMHVVMQHIDAKKFHRMEYLESYLQDLVMRELLLPEEAKTVDLLSVITLATGELGRRMAAAPILHRERAFNLLHVSEGKEVIVQGIIDCWFEEKGFVILIDYKTGKDGWQMDERYRAQLSLYKEALETILKKPVKEAYLYLFAEGRLLKVETD